MWRMVKILGIIAIIAGSGVWIYWFLEYRTPAKIGHSFLDAVQNRDWETVTKLLHPSEKEKLRLNAEQVKVIGEKLILPLWQRLGTSSGLKRIENPFLPTTEEEQLYFKDFHFFRLLRNSKEGAIILVTRTKEGWKVNFSLFVYSLLTEAAEQGKLPHNYIMPLLRKVGIFQIFIGQEGVPLPP